MIYSALPHDGSNLVLLPETLRKKTLPISLQTGSADVWQHPESLYVLRPHSLSGALSQKFSAVHPSLGGGTDQLTAPARGSGGCNMPISCP